MNQPISLLYFAPRKLTGGNRVYLQSLLEQLSNKSGLAIHAVLHRDNAITLPPPHKVTIFRPPNNELISWIHERSMLVALDHSGEFDLIHIPCTLLPFYRPRSKCVATIHDTNFLELDFSLPKRIYKKRLYQYTLTQADKIIAISEFTRKQLLLHFGANEKNITCIWNGQTPLNDPIPQNTDGSTYLLTFGHRKHKNARQCVEILAEVARTHRNIRLKVIGDCASVQSDVTAVARRLGVAGQVDFLGQVDRQTLHSLYHYAVCLLFLSHYEGFGLPALEAMALRCPVIGRDATALPEVIKNHGLLILDDNQPAVEKIQLLLDSPEILLDEIEEAYRFSREFSWERTADLTIAEYKKLLA